MNAPQKITRSDVNWDDTIESALEKHLDHLREYHQQVWLKIIDQDINLSDSAPLLFEPPSLASSERDWQLFETMTEEMFYEWQSERLRLDYEIPYFHLTSLFVHICISTESWLSSMCDLLAGYHGSRLSYSDLRKTWALSTHLRFLEDIFYLDLAMPPGLIQRIRGRYSIRNVIVHASPLFQYSPVCGRDVHLKQSKLISDGAFTASSGGKLQFNEAYLLQAFDDSITFSRAITNAI